MRLLSVILLTLPVVLLVLSHTVHCKPPNILFILTDDQDVEIGGLVSCIYLYPFYFFLSYLLFCILNINFISFSVDIILYICRIQCLLQISSGSFENHLNWMIFKRHLICKQIYVHMREIRKWCRQGIYLSCYMMDVIL